VGAATADGLVVHGDGRRQLVFSALCEAGILSPRAEDPARALPVTTAEARR